MSPRRDVSSVPLQGGYIAKQCPVVIQNRMLVPGLEADPPIEVRARMSDGIQFEHDVLEAARPVDDVGWVVIPQTPRELAQQETVTSMSKGVEVIEQAFLPADEVGRRTGRPDLLVRYRAGYVPVDIKHHRVLDEADDSSIFVSDPPSPNPEASRRLGGHTLRKHKGDALQLAHYRRMLEVMGAESSENLGGILGREGVVVWYDLDEPMWTTPAKSGGKKQKKRSSMEAYDFEFDFRLDIAATAIAVEEGLPALLVEPKWNSECGGCGFLGHCQTTLRAGSGDASLLPGLSYLQWRGLRDEGLKDRAHVATLHYPTSQLVRGGVEVNKFRELAHGLDPATPVSEVRPRAIKQVKALEARGVGTVGDLFAQTDELTAGFGGWAEMAILNARAATGPDPVYRRPGADGRDVPRADVEIDVDMESVHEGVYLWGTFFTDHSGRSGLDEGYRPFVSWEPIDDAVEYALFDEFWQWLGATMGRCSELGLTLAVYVWYESAEKLHLRRISRHTSSRHDVEEMLSSESWVDLMAVFDRSWIIGTSSSLKVVAPLAGHEWAVHDPGGGLSMVKYNEAVSDEDAAAYSAREWLLDYNKGDVLATKRIREWLTDEGANWPEVSTD